MVVEFSSQYIVPLHRGGRWQHDVGVLGRRRPEGPMEEDGVWPAPRFEEAPHLGVVVKRISAARVDELDARIGERLAVVLDGLARIQQHVGDAGDRDVDRDYVAAER